MPTLRYWGVLLLIVIGGVAAKPYYALKRSWFRHGTRRPR